MLTSLRFFTNIACQGVRNLYATPLCKQYTASCLWKITTAVFPSYISSLGGMEVVQFWSLFSASVWLTFPVRAANNFWLYLSFHYYITGEKIVCMFIAGLTGNQQHQNAPHLMGVLQNADKKWQMKESRPSWPSVVAVFWHKNKSIYEFTESPFNFMNN